MYPHHNVQQNVYQQPQHGYQYYPNPPPQNPYLQNSTSISKQFYLFGYQLYSYPIDRNWRNTISKFTRNSVIAAEEHIRKFNAFVQDICMEHEDVLMRLFMMSLTKEAMDWFNSLLDASITSIANFQDQFLK